MEKAEHAQKLRRAIGASGLSHRTIADAVNRDTRTISNWTSASKPTMPSEAEKIILRKLVGPYDQPGDPVEIAIEHSTLEQWRKTALKGEYQRHLADQGKEQRGA